MTLGTNASASSSTPKNWATSPRAWSRAPSELAGEEADRVGLHPVPPGLLLLENGCRHRAVRAVVEVRDGALERPQRAHVGPVLAPERVELAHVGGRETRVSRHAASVRATRARLRRRARRGGPDKALVCGYRQIQ